MTYEIGSVVRHGTGRLMTVAGPAFELGGAAYVPCQWFTDDNAVLWRGSFLESQLTRADPEPAAQTPGDAIRQAARDYHARQDAAMRAMRAMPDRAPEPPHPWFGPSGTRALAEELYGAYGDQASWRNFLGREMPTWAELPEHIQESWTAVARRAIARVGGER
jgi:hypothetical protein